MTKNPKMGDSRLEDEVKRGRSRSQRAPKCLVINIEDNATNYGDEVEIKSDSPTDFKEWFGESDKRRMAMIILRTMMMKKTRMTMRSIWLRSILFFFSQSW